MGSLHAAKRKPKAGSRQRRTDQRNQRSLDRESITCLVSGESEEKHVTEKSNTPGTGQILSPISTGNNTAATSSPTNANSANNGILDTVLSDPLCQPCGYIVYGYRFRMQFTESTGLQPCCRCGKVRACLAARLETK